MKLHLPFNALLANLATTTRVQAAVVTRFVAILSCSPKILDSQTLKIAKMHLAFCAIAGVCSHAQAQSAPESISGRIYQYRDVREIPPTVIGGGGSAGCGFAYGTNGTFSGILCLVDQGGQVFALEQVFGTFVYERTGSNTATIMHTILPQSIPYLVSFQFDTPASGSYGATFGGLPLPTQSGSFKEIMFLWMSRDETNATRLEWSGGSPPYVVEVSTSISNSSSAWQTVETTPNTSTTVSFTEPKAFFRVRSLPQQTSH